MKKIERRAVVCSALALLLAAGLMFFLVRYVTDGGDWTSAAFNRHLYDNKGVLSVGTVLDRDGDVLSSAENGNGPIMKMKRFVKQRFTRSGTYRVISEPGH